jgi:hypothetical protein
MAQWYNHIFYKDGDQPKPDAPILDSYTTLPIVDETSDLPNEEEVAQKSKLEFMFRQNFIFKGLPSDPDQQKQFFTQNQNRESDPAGIRQIDDKIKVADYKQIYDPNNFIRTPINIGYNAYVWVSSTLQNWLESGKKTKGGSGKNTKKRHSYSRRQMNKTQRRLLAVDDR